MRVAAGGAVEVILKPGLIILISVDILTSSVLPFPLPKAPGLAIIPLPNLSP